MELSPQQAQAMDAVGKWLKTDKSSRKPFFYLAGYAGTGKTTIAMRLAKLQDGDVAFAAYTGKAAQVLSKKGSKATTIHSLIYKVDVNEKTGEMGTILDKQNLMSTSLIVIDECSMVDDEVAQDLLSFEIPILVLGDPAQLPPIGGEGYFTRNDPDMLLTEVHRQALESPIMQLALEIREGRQSFGTGDFGDMQIKSVLDVDARSLKEYDAVITGTNKRRKSINATIRKSMGYTSRKPERGDIVMCLKNNKFKNIFNGQIMRIDSDVSEYKKEMAFWLGPNDMAPSVNDFGMYTFRAKDVDDVGSADVGINALGQSFDREPKQVPRWASHRMRVDDGFGGHAYKKVFPRVDLFDFGYAITCHKSQGSQWENLLVFNDSAVFGGSEKEWLYTAVTRAEKKLTLVV